MAWIETAAYGSTDAERTVATREGGVDRNKCALIKISGNRVATREGGVDRNRFLEWAKRNKDTSPPARVAWIETIRLSATATAAVGSPPARVAWIET